MVASWAVESGGVAWAVVGCRLMAMEGVVVGGWLGMMGGLLVGCCWRCWLVWAAEGVMASRDVGGVGVLLAVVGSC